MTTKNMFGYGNSKLVHLQNRVGKKVATFDLLAGHTCPMASDCNVRVIISKGHRRLKKLGKWACYAAKAELVYTATYRLHKINKTRTLRDTFVKRAIREIEKNRVEIMRIHSSGDFYSWEYFQKWYAIAQALPHVSFFGYTKQATFVKWLLAHPLPNLKIVYSHGGLLDNFAAAHNLPTCYVKTQEGQYPEIPVACGAVHSDDYEHVLAQHDFVIEFH